jgi:hypothetical protein
MRIRGKGPTINCYYYHIKKRKVNIANNCDEPFYNNAIHLENKMKNIKNLLVIFGSGHPKKKKIAHWSVWHLVSNQLYS